MNKHEGFINIIALIIAIVIIVAVILVIYHLVIGDNGVITKAEKVELNYAKEQVSEALLTILNNEKAKASSKIAGTTNDLSTEFNEKNIINFLSTKKEDASEETTTEPTESAEGENVQEEPKAEVEGLDCLSKEETAQEIRNVKEDDVIFDKYRIEPQVLSDKVTDYGKGKKIADGDVFVLEAVTETATSEDGVAYTKSTGKFELKYYNEEGKSETIETYDFYLTNQS